MTATWRRFYMEVPFDHAGVCEISRLWNRHFSIITTAVTTLAGVWSSSVCGQRVILFKNHLKLSSCLWSTTFLKKSVLDFYWQKNWVVVLFCFFYHPNSFPGFWSLVPRSLDSLAEWDKKISEVKRDASNIVHSTCCSLKTSCFECNLITEWDPGDCVANFSHPRPHRVCGEGEDGTCIPSTSNWKCHSGAHEAAVMWP